MTMLLSLFGYVAFISLFSLIWNYFRSPLREIPGPFVAKFTNLWRLFDVLKGQAHLTQQRLHEIYGPVVRLGPNIVSVNDPRLKREIYSFRFLKSPFYDVNSARVRSAYIGGVSILPNIFSTRSNDYHAKRIKPIQHHYAMSTLRGLESSFDHTLELFCNRVGKFANESCVIPMDRWLLYLTWDTMSYVTFHKTMGFLKAGSDINNMIRNADKAFDYFAIIGQMPWLDSYLDKNPIVRIGPPTFSSAARFCYNQLEERLQNYVKDVSETPDFLERFIQLKDSDQDITNDQIVAYLMINVVAGADTTAIALRAVMYYVHKDHRVLNKVRCELDNANLKTPVSYEKSQELPYLNAVIKEAMRLHPGIGLLMERIVPKGGLVLSNGYTVPENTIIGMNPWVMHRNNKAFGPDSTSFVPERWLKMDESDIDFLSRMSEMKSAILTFGAGHRKCLGQDFAMMEISKIIATILLKYDKCQCATPNDWRIRNSWFMRPSGMPMTVTHRKYEKKI